MCMLSVYIFVNITLIIVFYVVSWVAYIYIQYIYIYIYIYIYNTHIHTFIHNSYAGDYSRCLSARVLHMSTE